MMTVVFYEVSLMKLVLSIVIGKLIQRNISLLRMISILVQIVSG
jgi:hypothetical protein